MQRTALFAALPLLLAAGWTTSALADESLEKSRIESLLQSAEQNGFTHFEEISVDDGRLEVEGWGQDGWRLDVEMALEDGSMREEQRRKHQGAIPDWALSGDEVRQALDNAFAADMQRLEELDVDEDGRLEIEGYDAQNQEIELRLNAEDFSVTGVNNG